MPIWLGGAGRSDEDLARLIKESNGGKDTAFRYRRSHDRHKLEDANGELIYMDSRTACSVLEVSVGGCSVQTVWPFAPGALAPVEVVLPILGMVLRICGLTQWMKKEQQIGICFFHVNSWSKCQLERLIDSLRGRSPVESVYELIACQKLNPAVGNILAMLPKENSSAVEKLPIEAYPYNPLVHGGEGRLCAPKQDVWPVVFRSQKLGFCHSGTLIDLSPCGCTARLNESFAGRLDDPVEVYFGLQGLRFGMSGITRSIDNLQRIGVQFISVVGRRRDDLHLVLAEICTEAHLQLEVS